MKLNTLLILGILSLACQKQPEETDFPTRNQSRSYGNQTFLSFDRTSAIKDQRRRYSIVELIGDQVKSRSNMKGDITKYEIDDYKFYFGYDTNWMYYLEIEDKQGKVIGTHTDSSDSQIFNPTFYKTDYPGDPTVILIEGAGCGESWGNTVLVEYQERFHKIGYIDVATRYTKNNFEVCDNIAPYTDISINKGVLSFDFNISDIVYYSPKGDVYQEFLEGDDLSYQYSGGELITLRR